MYAPARWAYEPVPHGSVRQLALVRLHVSQQLLHVVYGNRRVHHQRDGCGRNLGHQREILLRFVGQFGVEELVDQHRGAERQQQGVAVGRGLGDGIGAQDAGGTTLVIHHHGLTDALGQGLAHGAGDDVRSAASVERHNQPYRLGRPGHLAGLRHRRAQQTAATEGRHRGPPGPARYCDGSFERNSCRLLSIKKDGKACFTSTGSYGFCINPTRAASARLCPATP